MGEKNANEVHSLRRFSIDVLSMTEVEMEKVVKDMFVFSKYLSASRFDFQIDIYYHGDSSLRNISFFGTKEVLFYYFRPRINMLHV